MTGADGMNRRTTETDMPVMQDKELTPQENIAFFSGMQKSLEMFSQQMKQADSAQRTHLPQNAAMARWRHLLPISILLAFCCSRL